MTTATAEIPTREATLDRLVRPFGIMAGALFTGLAGSRSHSHWAHPGETTYGAADILTNRPQISAWPALLQQLR